MGTPFFTAVTPNDDVAQTPPSQLDTQRADLGFTSLRVGSAGDVVVVNCDGEAISFLNCYNGEWLFVRGAIVKATGTTASDIVAFWG